MIVDAPVYQWTMSGMRPAIDTSAGYVTVRDAERLCEEAHARGRQQGVSEELQRRSRETPADINDVLRL